MNKYVNIFHLNIQQYRTCLTLKGLVRTFILVDNENKQQNLTFSNVFEFYFFILDLFICLDFSPQIKFICILPIPDTYYYSERSIDPRQPIY